MKVMMLVAIACSYSFTTFADCRKADLRSSNGADISIRYSDLQSSDGNRAWFYPGFRVLLNPGQCASAQSVSVVMVNAAAPHCGGANASLSQTIELKREGITCAFAYVNRSTEPLTSLNPKAKEIRSVVANHCAAYTQQVAVRVQYAENAEWLMDPISQSHNFTFKPGFSGFNQGTVEICQ